jgi:uncharacterized protein YdhG (YjbR/CyaY superfamily)
MSSTDPNAEQYFRSLPEGRSKALKMVRDEIFKRMPEITETMNYNMPTYQKDEEWVCSVANQKHYMAIYICHYDLLENFKDELRTFNRGKSCIRFTNINNDMLDLFGRIISFVYENRNDSRFYKT